MELTLQPLPDTSFDQVADHLVDHLVVRRFLGEQVDPVRAREAADAMLARVRDRTEVLDVLDGSTSVGTVWFTEQGDDRAVLHLRLDDPTRAGDVRVLLEGRGRDAGSARLTIGVFPGDPVTEAFVADAGFETAAVQMRLDLAGELPAEDVVVLEAMDEAAYALWEADEIESYAAARAKSGENYEHALKTSQEQHAQLLPDGLATEHHQFFVGTVDGETIGTLWIGTERPLAYVYDVLVDEAHRRKGYGGGLMRAGALWAREHGAPALGLNVFGYNHGARALYEGLGYAVVEVFEGKPLTTGS